MERSPDALKDLERKMVENMPEAKTSKDPYMRLTHGAGVDRILQTDQLLQQYMQLEASENEAYIEIFKQTYGITSETELDFQSRLSEYKNRIACSALTSIKEV